MQSIAASVSIVNVSHCLEFWDCVPQRYLSCEKPQQLSTYFQLISVADTRKNMLPPGWLQELLLNFIQWQF